MTPLFRKLLGLNWILLLNMLVLIAFGVYAIYNASAYKEGAELSLKWRDQIKWALVGLPIFFGAALIDYKWVRWACIPMYLMGIGALLLIEFYGVERLGNKAWVEIGGFSFQPSQIAITSGIMALAVVFGDLPRFVPVFRYHFLRIMLAGILAGIPMAMVAKEDLGSGLVWGPVFISMMLVGSIPFRYLIVLVLGALCVIPLAYFFGLKDYQRKRIDTTIYMMLGQEEKVNMQDEGWVAGHLQVAIGSAGFEGKGPLSKKVPDQRSIHRTWFPNESINDFIFAVVAEEFGFRGALLLLSLMLLLLIQGIFVAYHARDQLGRLIAVGVVAMIFAHTFQNAGMNLNLLPIIGLPMPFVSYGGTFLVVMLFLMGMVQSVWVHRNTLTVKKRGRDEERD
ncbi:MAG: FtsW/RodA/SpoVE family cell cycle protein [Verrucomicrobiales bacterium]|nr:FtsW/RodA/SpoVE family cell cycle protein [Verrucomicrobiales bacterium]